MWDEQDKRAWYILQASVTGAAHIRAQLPNQDAIFSNQKRETDVPLVQAISDGHGSEKYFRSDIGAKFAAEIAVATLRNFVQEAVRGNYSLSDIEKMAQHLPIEIVARWRTLVEKHWQQNRANDREWQWRIKKENMDAWKAITANDTLANGANLLAVVVTDAFIIYLQYGDGEILPVLVAGE